MFQPYGHPQVHFHLHYTYKNNFSVQHLAMSYIQISAVAVQQT
jgi:hypothetical protein